MNFRTVLTMNKFAFAVLWILLSIPVFAQENWRLVYEDHFDQLSSHWWPNWLGPLPESTTPPVNSVETTCYSPSQVAADGELRLTAIRQECRLENGRVYPHTSGLVVLRDREFLYGKFEASIWTPAGAGVWPSFWLFGGGFEINILEAYGDDRSTYHVHDPNCQGACDGGDVILRGATSNWHIYAVEWTSESISWFYDGELIDRRRRVVPNVPLRVVINLGINRDTASVPATMRVDWIRIWERSP